MREAVFLKTDRLTLRPPESEDYAFIASEWNTEHVRLQAGWPLTPVTTEDIQEGAEHGDDAAQFVICHDQDRIGFVTLFDMDWRARNAELSYMISPDEQGKGYATEAIDRTLTYAFDELGLHKVYAYVWDENEGSQHLLEKFGFHQEGNLRDHVYGYGEYGDQLQYGLLESER